jgi:hypothetical protein
MEALKENGFIPTFAPFMLLHLFYLKPNHALLFKKTPIFTFKTLKLFKMFFFNTLLKPYMFTTTEFTTRHDTDKYIGHARPHT